MKSPIYAVISALLISAFTACGTPSVEEQAGKSMNQILDSLNAVGLSVAVVKDNQLIYTGTFGYKNLEDSTHISANDLFRIASISKSFTATAIMQLYEEGKFKLDDDVSNALGIPVRNPNYPDTPITYRMLLTHTSSLNDTTGYFTFDVIDPQKTPTYANAYNTYAPGTQYQYCNLGFNMLGALVEKHSGERFDQYVKKHIIQPLGLNAGYNVDELDAQLFVPLYTNQAGRYVWSPDAYASRAKAIEEYVMGRSTPIFSPTGGMKISAKDLSTHMLVQMNGGTFNNVKILSPESVKAMQTPYEYDGKSFDYGFAITTTDKLIEGEVLKGHTGSAYGLYSAMFFEPEKKFGIIMMTNGSVAKRGDNGFLSIQSDVINALYGVFGLGE